MNFYNNTTKIITLFSAFLLILITLTVNTNSNAFDSIRNDGFDQSSIAINKADDSQPTLIKLKLDSDFDSEQKEMLMNNFANSVGINIDYSLANLDSFVATINNSQLSILKNQNIVLQSTPYKSYSVPLNIQQDNSLETTVLTDYDKNIIPKYLSAIGITDSKSKNGMTGKGQYIGIIDTGVDFNQPELKNVNAVEACFSDVNKEYGIQSYSVCPNGKTTQIGVGASKPCDDTLATGCSHGTHVAGILAGRRTSRNHPGIAPEAKLVSVNVFHIIENEAKCNPQNAAKTKKETTRISKCIYTSNLAYLKGINFVIEQNKTLPIAALNMSLGSNETKFDDCNDIDTPNFQAVIDNNIPLVIASGNGGDKKNMSHPACQSNVISVGAYDEETKSDAIFSNVSPKTTLFATGSSIESVGYTMTGTSMATPMVSGTIALLRQAGLSDVSDIRDNLVNNGSSFNSDTTVNGKLINISKSLQAVNQKTSATITPKPIKSTVEPKPEIITKPIQKPVTPSSKCTTGQPGWCAQYYNNKTLSGKVAATKAIPALNTYNQRISAEKGVYADKFSAKFTAKFNISNNLNHIFRYNFDDGVRVTLTHEGFDYLIIDEWKNQAPKNKEYSEFLEPGEYTIKVEYYDNLLGSTRMLDVVDSNNKLIQFYNK